MTESTDNLLPVVMLEEGVTDATPEQMRQQATAAVAQVMEESDVFVVIALKISPEDGSIGSRIAGLFDDSHLVPMTSTLLTTIGAERLGEQALAQMPPSIAQPMCLATGARIISQAVNAALQPRTPATDAEETKH